MICAALLSPNPSSSYLLLEKVDKISLIQTEQADSEGKDSELKELSNLVEDDDNEEMVDSDQVVNSNSIS